MVKRQYPKRRPRRRRHETQEQAVVDPRDEVEVVERPWSMTLGRDVPTTAAEPFDGELVTNTDPEADT